MHVSIGQLHYLLDRERLTEERVDALPEAERRGLETLRRAQSYGESLGLAASSSYRHVIDRDTRSAVRVVTASPADRLEPLSWWFPIVGNITYRGYFDEARARAFADSLARDGYDTYVRPALMYSTLGYFDDPIPLAVLRWPEVDLVDVILHEQVHETIFVAGDPGYNEGLASFISSHATPGFFDADPGRPEQRREAEDVYADRARFAALLDALFADLEALYAETDGPEDARQRRVAVLARYQGPRFSEQEWKTGRYVHFPAAELNNSYLLARRTYQAEGPCFEAEFGALGGDLRAFITAHIERPGHRACPEDAK